MIRAGSLLSIDRRDYKMKRFYYDTGLPFSFSLKIDLDDLKIRTLKHNKASMLIIDGLIGTGKTTLATHCADYLNGGYEKVSFQKFKVLEDKLINLKEQLALGGNDFAKKLRLSHEKSVPVLIYDEAGDFNSRGALTKFNAMVNRVFEVFRAFKVIVILCLPSFTSLDKSLMTKGVPRLLIHIDDRNQEYGDYKVYSLWHIHYILDKMKKLIVKTDAFRLTQPVKRGHFLDLPKERAKELDIISTANKLDTLEDVEIKIDGLFCYNDLAKRLGRSISWISKAMNKLHIPAKKVYKNRKYFDDNALEILSEEIDKQVRSQRGKEE